MNCLIYLLTKLTHLSGAFTIDLEQVNARWSTATLEHTDMFAESYENKKHMNDNECHLELSIVHFQHFII